YLIDNLLRQANKSLSDWPMMPQPQQDWHAVLGNRLIRDQRDYNLEEQAQIANEHLPNLNAEQ
ncbi:hypothetical protein CPB84DRAFT_1628618, partial [Gymnopilus junonius]